MAIWGPPKQVFDHFFWSKFWGGVWNRQKNSDKNFQNKETSEKILLKFFEKTFLLKLCRNGLFRPQWTFLGSFEKFSLAQQIMVGD